MLAVPSCVVQVLADVALDSGCVKAAGGHCAAECEMRPASARASCLKRCSGEEDAAAVAFAEALASIDITDSLSCLTDSDPVGEAYWSEDLQVCDLQRFKAPALPARAPPEHLLA